MDTRAAYPAPDTDAPTVATSAPAASLPRADAPSVAAMEAAHEQENDFRQGVRVKPTETAVAIARGVISTILQSHGVDDPINEADVFYLGYALDAYAAALTQEQRDVLTLFEYAKGGGNVELWTDHAGLNVALNGGRNAEWKAGPDAIHAAAEWVRAQGGE